MRDFQDLTTMNFQNVADIAYFWLAVTEKIQFFFTQWNIWDLF